MDKVFGHIINSTHNDAILKLIETKFLNGTKYATFNDTFYPYKDQVIRIMYKILKEGLFSSENEQNKNITIYILELIRDNPKICSKIFDFLKLYLNDNKDKLKEYLVQTNMSFLYNLTEEIIDFNSTFFDDLSKVIENYPEIINYTLIVVNADARGEKNMTNHLKNITYILNIDGMDKVFSHIINSTHNGAIFKLIETRIINGTKYTTLFGYFKPILIKYKDQIIRFMYQMLKTYYDKNALRDVITNFFLENRNNELMRDLREKCKEENVRKELKEKIMLGNISKDIIKEELLVSPEIVDAFFDLIDNNKTARVVAGFIACIKNVTYIEDNIVNLFIILFDEDKEHFHFFTGVGIKVLKRIIWAQSTSLYFAEKMMEKLFKLFFEKDINNYKINRTCASSMEKIYFKKFNTTNEEVKDSLIQMRYFFMKKTILDSTKNKNDFLTYENCLEKDFDYDLQKKLDLNFTLKPIYILAMIDDNKSKEILSDSILLEQYNYWLGYCLPYP